MAVRAINDVLDIIEILKEEHEIGISDLSKRLKMNKNKVFRLLVTLELKGVVELNKDTGKYKLGNSLFNLYKSYLKSLYFLDIAKPYIRNLRMLINENIYISIEHRKDVIYVFEEQAHRSVLVKSLLAKRIRAEKTAPGRALKRAKKETGFTVEYVTNSEITEIATIIKDEFYFPIASISIVIPSFRITPKKLESLFKSKLIETAEEITGNLSPNFSLD